MSQISQLFTFHNGSLINRLETVEVSQGITLPIYDQRMMEFDDGVFQPTTHQPKHVTLSSTHQAKMVHTGDIVINMMTSECVIVSQQHHESILPYNYTHIEIDTTHIDANYFVYWMNASAQAKSQLNQFKQGGSLVKKLTLNQLKQLKMTLPSLEQQQRIGKLDERRRHLKYLQAKRTYLMDQFLSEYLFKEKI
ncbi:restriction endonuclease subunit S [Staphylococcus epidermidis]|uniref:restriction endonuclease subunit S n=1 Tax=Staphylococcus epidermidis TaxID=1282 RepID=UPI001244D80B|nr:restriction endonuclease subunit S [Staphylococcus epidermidis]KAA9272590.1 restriction endonuclease subunit S [Staphylococcus epidermidis]MDH8913594.1 restriction endonuclease subunit S [Staphylococcus epidermidis]MDH8941607.1 restriction endonuclease subunit S [Staphylococcus epidermidis]MDH9661446.1 restriction endonuclease subunit S [Staphylococcus epidermidis]MDH9674112.1 restriction endonuclease subunit S [Staphylococcus epidermidis]